MLRFVLFSLLIGVALADPICLEPGVFSGMIIGVVVGSILLTTIVFALIVCCCIGGQCVKVLSRDS